MTAFIEFLNTYFGEKAPQLPAGFKEFIVKIAPWLTIVSIVFTIPALLTFIGFTSIPGGFGVYYGNSMLFVIFALVLVVLEILSLSGLFKRTMAGWTFSFYAVLVSALQSLLMMNLVSLIIGFAIGCYILFQIRSYYTGSGTTSSGPTMTV